jgi:NADH:ubiquinone oxidoreductase subunit D
MADTILFDKLAFIDRLKRAGIEDNQARAHAEAMEDALRESVATKADIARLENMIHSEITRLENKIESVETRDLAVRDMTIRMGAIAVALFAALASIKFFG